MTEPTRLTLHRLLHQLWTDAVGRSQYDKPTWMALDNAINALGVECDALRETVRTLAQARDEARQFGEQAAKRFSMMREACVSALLLPKDATTVESVVKRLLGLLDIAALDASPAQQKEK